MKCKIILYSLLLSLACIAATGQTVKSLKSVGSTSITIIEISNKGDTWVGTLGDGVYHFDSTGQLLTHFAQDSFPTLVSDTINAISLNGDFSGNNYAYLGTPSGMQCIKSGAIENPLMPDTSIAALILNSNNTMTALTSRHGAATVNDTSQVRNSNPTGIPFTHISCAQGPYGYGCDSAGLTIGSIDSGACYTYDYVHYTTLQGLVSDSVTAVWRVKGCNARVIGTRHGFSFCPDNMPCQNYDTLPDNYITSIAQDCNGNIWLGTRSAGIEVFTPPTQTFRRITTANGLSTNNITALGFLSDSSACVNTGYVGTTDGNIALVDSSFNDIGVLNGIQQTGDNANTIIVFPQPAHGQVNFLLGNELQSGNFCLTDINGKVLGRYDLKATNKFTLDISSLASGLYIYKVYSSTQIFKTGKFEVLK